MSLSLSFILNLVFLSKTKRGNISLGRQIGIWKKLNLESLALIELNEWSSLYNTEILSIIIVEQDNDWSYMEIE